jgi:hypothetical protein
VFAEAIFVLTLNDSQGTRSLSGDSAAVARRLDGASARILDQPPGRHKYDFDMRVSVKSDGRARMTELAGNSQVAARSGQAWRRLSGGSTESEDFATVIG